MIRLFLIIALLAGYGLDVRLNGQVETRGMVILGPDNSFSIQEILNNFDAIAQLSSSMLRHRKDSTAKLARL
jgi:hypothetical protein